MALRVTISRTISTDVKIDDPAITPRQAADTVSAVSYPLPPRDQWDGVKDWHVIVTDTATGEELHESER
jgi:hypothetical protein